MKLVKSDQWGVQSHGKITSFRELNVWRRSFILTKEIYHLTDNLPAKETYGLTNQIRKCAISIPSNIAEGQQRNNTKEFRQFLGIAKGSSAELETQLMLATELYNLNCGEVLQELEEIQKMIQAILNKLATHHSSLTTGDES